MGDWRSERWRGGEREEEEEEEATRKAAQLASGSWRERRGVAPRSFNLPCVSCDHEKRSVKVLLPEVPYVCDAQEHHDIECCEVLVMTSRVLKFPQVLLLAMTPRRQSLGFPGTLV